METGESTLSELEIAMWAKGVLTCFITLTKRECMATKQPRLIVITASVSNELYGETLKVGGGLP